MGMDVYGKDPSSSEGEYFRSNVWYWHPLWTYCENMHPSLANKVKDGHSNSGDGLNKPDSIALATLLKRDIESGVTQKYIKDYYKALDEIPLEDCTSCHATGEVATIDDDTNPVIKVCNYCKGEKKIKPFQTWYHMELDLIKEFQQFLESCGGFRIC
jgi:hypothetical protein